MKTPQIIVILFFIISLVSCKQDSTKEKDHDSTEVVGSIPAIDSSVKQNPAINSTDSSAIVQLDTIDSVVATHEENKLDQTDKEKAKSSKIPIIKKPVAEKKGKPIITFEKNSYDFGTINQGERINYEFKFINSGSSPLIIKNATATCGCTQPSYPFLPIAPNETGIIGVRYNSTGKHGPQKPIITITSNAKPSVSKLYLDGTVLIKEEEKDSKKEG